jgi:HEAT repeat protein
VTAQPATAPPAVPTPAAAPAQPASPAPAATPTPAAAPAMAPFDFNFNIDVDALMDNVQSLARIDMEAFREQATAAARLQGEQAREMAERIRAGMEGQMSFDMAEQSERLQDMVQKQKEKAFELRDKALEKGWVFAQNVPTPAMPPGVARGMAGQRGPVVPPMRGPGRNPSVDRLYESGKSSLDAHRFDDALAAFSEIVSRGGDKVEGALYYKAYTLNKLGRRDEAVSTIAELRKGYPSSRWLDDASALEVEVKQAAGKPVSPEDVSSDDIKLIALNGLMQTEPDRAYPILEGLLKGPHSPNLKRQAVYVLAQNQSPKAQALLEQIARGSTGNPDLQLRAISFFVDTRNKPDRAKLLAEVYVTSNDNAVKSAIIQSFSRSRDIEHLSQVAKTEKNPELRDAAIGQLGEVDGQPELWQMYAAETTPEGKKSLLNYMQRNGNTEKLLEVARTDKDASVRSAAIRVLGTHKGPNVAAAMVTIYGGEQDASVKKTIIGTLADQRDAKSLVDVGRKEKDIELKRIIVRRLSDMRTPEATEFLLEILKP